MPAASSACDRSTCAPRRNFLAVARKNVELTVSNIDFVG